MPIIEIWTLPPAGPLDVPGALSKVTTAVASFLDEDASGTWAILHPIAPGHFAEGEDAPSVQPGGTHPALVRVFANRDAEDVPALLQLVGASVVDAFGLEEGNVVVRFEPARTERMFWG